MNLIPILMKATLLLAGALCLLAALSRANPRWRMMVCEGVVVGVLLLPLMAVLPFSLNLPFLPLTEASGGDPSPGMELRAAEGSALNLDQLNMKSPSASGEVVAHPELIETGSPGSVSLTAILLVGYLSGLALMLGRRLRGSGRLSRMLKKFDDPDEGAQRTLEEIAREMGVRSVPRFLVADARIAPLACRMGRGVVVIPRALLDDEQAPALRMALRHELHHLMNLDLLRALGLQLFVMALWFHPLAWLLRRSHSLATEELSDRVAAEEAGTGSYSATLAQMTLSLRPRPELSMAAVGLFHTPQVVARLRRLKHPVPHGRISRGRKCLALGALIFPLVLGLSSRGVAHPKHREGGGGKEAVSFAATLPKEKRTGAAKVAKQVLDYLVAAQHEDGSLGEPRGKGRTNQSAISAMAGMAFLGHGGANSGSPYHEPMMKCLAYVLSVQDEQGVFLASAETTGSMYHHCIATCFVASVAGEVKDAPAPIRDSLARALKIILEAQAVKKNPASQGGWRYTPVARDSDLSVSAWAMRALLAARDAGVDIPNEAINAGVEYVLRVQNEETGGFTYTSSATKATVPLTGMGLFILQRTGRGRTPQAQRAADFILADLDADSKYYFYYGMLWCAPALMERGGEEAGRYAAWMLDQFSRNQAEDGSFNHSLGIMTSSASAALAMGSAH